MGVIREAVDLIERFPKYIWRTALLLSVVGGAVRIFISLGVIEPDAMHGWIRDGAALSIALGVGLLCLGFLYVLLSLLSKVPAFFAVRKLHRRKSAALLENIRFLPPTSALLLLYVTQLPGGRFPAMAYSAAFERLWELDLIEEDEPSPYVIVSGPPRSGMVRVSPRLKLNGPRLRARLVEILSLHYPGDLNDHSHVSHLLEKTLELERQ